VRQSTGTSLRFLEQQRRGCPGNRDRLPPRTHEQRTEQLIKPGTEGAAVLDAVADPVGGNISGPFGWHTVPSRRTSTVFRMGMRMPDAFCSQLWHGDGSSRCLADRSLDLFVAASQSHCSHRRRSRHCDCTVLHRGGLARPTRLERISA